MTLTYQHFFIWYELTLEQSISNIAISLKFVQLKLLVGKIPLIFFFQSSFLYQPYSHLQGKMSKTKKNRKEKSRPCGYGQSLGRPIVRSIFHFFWSTKKIFVQSQGIFGESLNFFGQDLIFWCTKKKFWYTKMKLGGPTKSEPDQKFHETEQIFVWSTKKREK